MNLLFRHTRVLVGAAMIAAALSACSGGSQLAPSVSQQSQAQRADAPRIPSLDALRVETKKKAVPLIFAADSSSSDPAVYAYEDSGSNQSPVWKLSAGLKYPAALWVDGSLNLYVGDQAGYVYEYNAPTASGAPSAPNFTYKNLGNVVSHLALCGDYLYASDLIGGSQQSAGFTVWKVGNATPVAFVTQPNYEQVPGWGIACNAKSGSVYFGYEASYAGPGEVDQYAAGGIGSPQTLCASPGYEQGLTFNKSFTTLIIGDAYASPTKGPGIEFWKPSSCSPTHSIFASWIAEPTGFAYESTDKYLWDADNGNDALHKFTPSKGTLLNTITSTGTGTKFVSLQDVAVSPPDHP